MFGTWRGSRPVCRLALQRGRCSSWGRIETENEQTACEEGADSRGTGRPNPSRETKFLDANGDREILIFPVQLTTSRIGNLTRLIHPLLYVMTMHTLSTVYCTHIIHIIQCMLPHCLVLVSVHDICYSVFLCC